MLRFTFASLHQYILGIKPEEHVPIPNYQTVTVPYEFLLFLEQKKQVIIYVPYVPEAIHVQILLGEIETPDMRQQIGLSHQEIFEQLNSRLNAEELRHLCFKLGVSYDDLGGWGRADKIRELILYADRHGRLRDLFIAFDN